MSPDGYQWAYKFVKLVTKDEVKTPLSFMFKLVPWLILGAAIVLYAPIPDDLKLFALKALLFSLLGLVAAVLLFAWFRPKHLVYGESGHRGEHKAEWGTEAKRVSAEERDSLPAESNPELPALEDRR